VNDQHCTLTATIPADSPGVHVTGGRAEPTAALNGCEEQEPTLRTGFRTPHRQAHSQSFYQVRNSSPDKPELPGGNLDTVPLFTVTNLNDTVPHFTVTILKDTVPLFTVTNLK
jgi:hypothetical protein